MQRSGAALLDHIDGHSQGGTFPLLIADARPRLAKALVLLEPSIFSDRAARAWGLSDVPLTYEYSPSVEDPARDLTRETRPAPDKDHAMCILQAEEPTPRRLANLVDMPILVVTSQSGYHAQYDYCTVEYLRQAGCSTEHVELGEDVS
ncbi:hypothetical protein OCS_06800 [Ophiocordyceps sinensis CO18]|uniref:Uncharacterized protein n=1 Tax=Ophiocordyceps sinensis (strain Co18 / CGMCC 3.14243) TaxID=911162 RepID=T5A6P3_OPHSC|nr:hypothetical protein OCS_06800 [Ophiocordyceps sinensis CO18]